MRRGVVLGLLAVVSFYFVLGASHCRAGVFEFKGKGGEGANLIRLQYSDIDTRAGEPVLPMTLSIMGYPSGVSGYYIIQFTGPVQESWKEDLKAKGVKFFGYLPDNAFIVKMTGAKASSLKANANIKWVGIYQPAYKIARKVMARISAGPLSTLGVKKYDVKVFDGEDIAPVKDRLESMGGTVEVVADTDGLNGKLLRVEVVETKVEDISRMTEVEWVEEYVQPTIQNDVAVGPTIMNVTPVWADASHPLTGTGQVVAVMDSGLDTGDLATINPAFAGNAGNGLPKVKQAFSYPAARSGSWSDLNGHGTHTSGSVLGKAFGGFNVKGVAYDAQLVFQCAGADATGSLFIPDLNATSFPDAYNAGARVHSDSWGSVADGGYTTTCVSADTYLWNHKDFVAVFAAGNSGADANLDGVVDLGSMGSPGTAKNVITVGASENYRPTARFIWAGVSSAAPLSTDNASDNVNGMAAFSSRGPCQDGRWKPDVVAPGTCVLSTRSSIADPAHYWALPSSVNAGSMSATLDPYFALDGGTSMATPLTAGACALIRQFYTTVKGVSSPSSALIKATLIAGARDMFPGQYGVGATQDVTAWPDNNQGWGRVNLDDSVYPTAPYATAYVDATPGIATGATATYPFNIGNTTVPVRVALVWTDYPGSDTAVQQLVNDLDMKVTAPNGTIYHGNMFTGGYSAPNPAEIPDTYDGFNNLEVVQIPASALTAGTLNVSVYGWNVAQGGTQPFAVVVRGGVVTNTAPTTVSFAPSGVNAATGALQTYSVVYSDANGATDIKTAYLMVNTSVTGAGAAYMYYDRPTNKLYLRDDANASWGAGSLVGAGGTTLTNSRCSVNCLTSGAVASGNTLTLTLKITYLTAFVGAKNVYMNVIDAAGAASNWTARGTVYVNAAPTAVSVTPSSGTPVINVTQTYALKFTDLNGVGDIRNAYVLINTGISGTGVYLYYYRPTGRLYLRDDANTTWGAGSLLGASGTTLTNSRCSIDCVNSLAGPTGNDLNLTLKVSYKSGFTGLKNIYMYVDDSHGLNSGWQTRGTVNVLGATNFGPTAVSVTPSSGSASVNVTQTYALKYSDQNGVGDIKNAYMMVNTSISGAGGVYLYYNRPTGRLYLRDDANTSWGTGSLLGASGSTLTNSRCSIDCVNSLASPTGNDLNLTLKVIYKPGFTGLKNIYMYVDDSVGANSGWVARGTVTIN